MAPPWSPNCSTAVGLALMPSLCSMLTQCTSLRAPSDPSALTRNFGTTNRLMPFTPSGAPAVAVVARDGQHLRRQVLGQPVAELGAVGVQYLGHAGHLAGGLGGAAGVVAGDQHVHVAAAGERGADGVEGGALEAVVVVFSDDECAHDQITFETFFSLSTSVATSGTLMPAPRLGGSVTFSVLIFEATSTPRSAGLTMSSVFFLAFMMFGSVT